MDNQLWLPGLPFQYVDVFKVSKGQRVLEKSTGRMGRVSRIDEGAAECIEAFIKFDGETKEYKSYQLKTLVVA